MNLRLLNPFAPWLLTALVLLVLLPGTAVLPIVDRDEPRFATATREMINRGDWVVPTFNGNDRFDKPVLTYWLMRAGYALAGVGELGARLPTVAATLLLVLLTWHTGRRWFDATVGFIAAAALATCLQVLIHGRLALADMPMVACVALAQVALLELLGFGCNGKVETPLPSSRGWWWAFYVALGVGFLAKGPVVLAVPLLSALLFRFVFWREPLPWSRLRLGWGLLLTLAIAASWGIPALIETHGRFWQVGMGEHVVQRGFEKFNGRGYTPFFYLATAPLSLFPWIVFAGVAFWAAKRTCDQRNAWLLSWLAAPYLIFTAYATQLPHYVLPAFPAFFLLMAQGAALPVTAWPRWVKAVAWLGTGLAWALVVAAGILLSVTTLPTAVEPLRGGLWGAALILGGLAALPLAWTRLRVFAVATGVASVALGVGTMSSHLRQVSAGAHFAELWQGQPTGTRFVGYGFSEPSAVFYTGGPRWIFTDSPERLNAEIAQPGPLIIATVLDECDPLDFFKTDFFRRFGRDYSLRVRKAETDSGTEQLEAIAHSSPWVLEDFASLNLGRTRWQTVRVLRRK